MIGLSSITQSTSDFIVIKEDADSELRNERARMTRSATLDGGAVIDHLGFADGDRTLKIKATVTEADETTLWSMFRNLTYVNVVTRDGHFKGCIESMKVRHGKMQMIILIEE